jgi:hypothetical protein
MDAPMLPAMTIATTTSPALTKAAVQARDIGAGDDPEQQPKCKTAYNFSLRSAFVRMWC